MRHCLVALIALSAAPGWADGLDHIGTFEWRHEAINGMSAIELSEQGSRFDAVSDRGWYLTGQLIRDGDQITEVKVETFTALRGMDGFPRAARRINDWSDSEGLAIDDDGTIFVSFERWAHVAGFSAPDGLPQFIKDHPTFYEFAQNRQLEALALTPDGTLLAFSEQPVPGQSDFPVFALRDGAWVIDGSIRKTRRYGIVGADYDDAGTLYLLERKLVLGLWWQNRIRTFDTPSGEGQVIWESRPGQYFNLEGISVWADDVGPRITLISDNNQDTSEPTQIVEFRLTD